MGAILVVQWHSEIRSLMYLLLRQRGYDVRTAADFDCVSPVAESPADLLIADVAALGGDPAGALHETRRRLGAAVPMLLTDVNGLWATRPPDEVRIADGFFAPRQGRGFPFLVEVERLLAPPVDVPRPVYTWRLDKRDLPPFLYACFLFEVNGALTLRDGRIHKQLFFIDGWIRCASSSVESDWLGKMLLADRRISETSLNEVERALPASKRMIGQELVARGYLDDDQLRDALFQQYASIAVSVFDWDFAEISLGEGKPNPQPHLAQHPFRLIASGVAHGFSELELDAALGGPERRPTPMPWTAFRFAEVDLSPEESELLALLDGRRTIATVLAEAPLPPLQAKQLLVALAAMRMIDVAGPSAGAAPAFATPRPASPKPLHEGAPPIEQTDADEIAERLFEEELDRDESGVAGRLQGWRRSLAAAGDGLRWRVFQRVALFYLLLGIAASFSPLTHYLGLEFSLVVGIAAGAIGGPFAVSLYWRRTGGHADPRHRQQALAIGAGPLWAEAIVLHSVAASFTLVGLAARAVLFGTCAPLYGAGFFVLLPLVSIAYAAAWGLVFGSLVKGPRRAKLAVLVFALVTLAWSGLEFVFKPALWFYNGFFGYFPGPIYDEVALPNVPLLAYRATNVAFAGILVLLLPVLWRRLDRQSAPRTARAVGAVLLFTVLLGVYGVLYLARFDLGFDMTTARLKTELDGHVATAHFDIWYPRRSFIEDRIRLVALEHEHRFAQIEHALGVKYPHRVTSFIYPNEDEKKRLIGAAETEYADCAKHLIHLNWDDFPLEILHHELMHVMLGELGLPVLGFSAKVAVTEGLAGALGGPHMWDIDLDRWAAGMLAMNRLPPMRKILGVRFWGEAGARAYVAAASFIRYLAAQPDGMARLRRAYRWGDVGDQFDRPLQDLEAEWRAHLTAIAATLSAAEIEQARYRFGFKSMFEMRCPREVARLMDKAREKANQAYYHRADLLYGRAAKLDRDEIRISRKRLPPLLHLGRFVEAERLAKAIVATQGTPDNPARNKRGQIVGSQIIAHEALQVLADLHWSRGERDESRAIYETIRDAGYRDNLTRHAVCALYGLDHPVIEPHLRGFFTDFTHEDSGPWLLTLAVHDAPDDPVVAYLQARGALRDEAYPEAIRWLDQALSGELPHRVLVEETLSGLGYAYFMLGDLTRAEPYFRRLRDQQIARGGSAIAANDWLARIAAWPGLETLVPR
jgi:tetratricopeptide (TPR) repeat protein